MGDSGENLVDLSIKNVRTVWEKNLMGQKQKI